MHKELTDSKWDDIQSQIQMKWGRFTQNDLDALKENLDEVVTRIRKVYGYTRDQAEREYHEFRVSLRPMMQHHVSR